MRNDSWFNGNIGGACIPLPKIRSCGACLGYMVVMHTLALLAQWAGSYKYNLLVAQLQREGTLLLSLDKRERKPTESVTIDTYLTWVHTKGSCNNTLLSLNQKNSRRLELSISKSHPAQKVGTRCRQCRPKVPGRFAFPSARSPRMCCISRFGNIFPAIFPGLSLGTPRTDPGNSHSLLEFSDLKVIRRLFTGKCFLEGFLEGTCKGFQ